MARGSQATKPVRPWGRSGPKGDVARGGALAQGLRSSAPSRFFFAHPDVAAALLFALFVLVYLWPVLIGGKMLSPIAMLYGVAPWRDFAPSDIAGYSNGLLSDVPTADYPWRWLIREMLHDGTFPSWNPYVFGGIPLYSNPQTGLFSLFSLPLWILPLNYGIGVGAALKLWAGGFGTYLLVRQLKLGFLPGLLAGVCFSFSAINITWLTHETLPAVAVMLPWMLWLVERIFQGGRLGCLLGLAAVTAVGLGGGHPGMQVHLLAAAGMYALLRAAFMRRDVARGERLRPLGLAFGGILLGTLLMGFMLLPEALSSRETIGTAARSGGRGTLPGTEMPLTAIRTVLFPDWWGRPSSFEGSAAPITELEGGVLVGLNYNERTFYAGVVGLLLALVAVVAPGGWRRKGPFAALAFLGLAIPLHLPGLYQLVTHLPAFELVQNQRLHFVWALAVSVLAAFGLQAVVARPAGDRWRLAVGLGALLLGVVALVSAGSGAGAAVGRTVEHFVTGKDFHSNAVTALTSGVWYLAFALGVGLALLAARRWPARAGVAGGVVVLLAAADMLHFANGYQPMAPASKAIPPRTGAIAFLEQRRHEGRIVGIGGTLLNDWSLTYGLHDIRGYDPPQPSERYFRLWQIAEPGQLNWTSFAMESLSPVAMQIASMLGARYVVADPGTQLPEDGSASVRALSVVYDGEDARVFENERAMPRAMVAPSVRVVEGEEEARLTITDPELDPRSGAVVERGDPGAAGLASGAGAVGSASVFSGTNARVVLRAELDRRGLVVLNDAWSPGWTVRVDGERREPVRVNDVMRGVVAGPGTHEIEWRYRVPGLRAGVALTLVGVVAVLAMMGLIVMRRAQGRARLPTA
jgi:hypothetical protein